MTLVVPLLRQATLAALLRAAVAAISALALVLLLAPAHLAAQPVTVRNGPLTVSLTAQGTLTAVTVSPVGAAKAQVFPVADPSRIVIDLPGVFVGRNLERDISGGGAVYAVRIGTHPRKTRVVLDLVAADIPPFEVIPGRGRVQILIGSKAKKSAPVASPRGVESARPPTRPTARPAAERLPPPTPVMEATPEFTPLPPGPPPTPDIVATFAAKTALQGSTGSGQRVTGLTFGRTEDGSQPVARLILTERPRFNLSKSGERSWRIVVPEAELAGEHLAHPFFPPGEFLGLSMIQLSRQDSGVAVAITAEPRARVTAVARNNEILIRAITRESE